MRREHLFKDNNAVSEVVGGILLVLIAVMSFAVIYTSLFPDMPSVDKNIKLVGYVTDEGVAVLEHVGGGSISSYRVEVRYINGTLINSTSYITPDSSWTISECIYPLEYTDYKLLLNNTDMVKVIVYIKNGDGDEQQIFSGILRGNFDVEEPSEPPDENIPMLVSSLEDNTVDEDLICFNYSINPTITPLTYIYNWIINGEPVTDIAIAFDTDTIAESEVKDYSGNNFNGTIFGPVWSSGICGGGYYFDGTDDYISLPYCFDGNYIDEITVEAWIQTSDNSGVIASYERNTLWELLINDGKLRWFTHANGETSDVAGKTNVADSIWHHVAATYDSSTGNCSIYVDGVADTNENGHNPGQNLGTGATPSGFIGTTTSGDLPSSWEVLTYDDFEDGFGSYTEGGRDCKLYTGGTYAHQGDNAADIQDDDGQYSSFYHTNYIDVSSLGYTSIKVDFWFIADSMEDWEDFWVRYYDGSDWITIADYDAGDEFVNGQFYHKIVWINETDYTFPTNMKIRFECSASGDYDDIFIDEVYVNATTGLTSVSNYSEGIDEFRIYNRVLSAEQIYQNYLCMKDGLSDKSVIVSEETQIGETWLCNVTPNDAFVDDTSVDSNTLQVVGYSGGES